MELLPERKFIPEAVGHVGRNGEQLHENCCQIDALATFCIEEF